MGFFGGLNAEKYDRQYSDRQLVGRISEYFRPQVKRLIAISALVLIIAGVGAMLPVVVSRIVDLLEGQLTVQSISLAGLALFVVGVGIWGLNWVRRALVVRSVGDVVQELRTKAFHAAAEHDLSFYDQFSSGRIVSRITADTNDFGQLVVIVTDVGAQMFQAIILGIILVRAEWHMALLMFAFIPFIFLIARWRTSMRPSKKRLAAFRLPRTSARKTASSKPLIFPTSSPTESTSSAVLCSRWFFPRLMRWAVFLPLCWYTRVA